MEEYVLMKPTVSHIDEIHHFRMEMKKANSSMDGTGSLNPEIELTDWLERCQRMEIKEFVAKEFVTAEQFVFLRKKDGRLVGMIQFRHALTDSLKQIGGHIGYSVLPNERQKGIAKKMLAACLEVAREYGLKEVLLTCNNENEASRRTILANGGVYSQTYEDPASKARYESYWIML